MMKGKFVPKGTSKGKLIGVGKIVPKGTADKKKSESLREPNKRRKYA
jgi:hypothetical protein